jgi:hypothetical protein
MEKKNGGSKDKEFYGQLNFIKSTREIQQGKNSLFHSDSGKMACIHEMNIDLYLTPHTKLILRGQ